MANTRKPSSEHKRKMQSRAMLRRSAEKRLLEQLKAEYVDKVGYQHASTAGDAAFLQFLKNRGGWRQRKKVSLLKYHGAEKARVEQRTGHRMNDYDEVFLWVRNVVKLQQPASQ